MTRRLSNATRIEAYPGIVLRSGATGRRAGLAHGPDVWEVARSVRSARDAEPGLTHEEILRLVAENTAVPLELVRVAVRYWLDHPDDIDAEIRANDMAEK